MAHSGTGSQQSCGGEGHGADGEHEQAHCASPVANCLVDDFQERTCRAARHCIKVLQYEKEDHQYDKGRASANGYCQDHGAGSVDGRTVDFVNQVRCAIRSNQTEGGLKKPQDPRHTIVPACRIHVVAENELCILVVGTCPSQASDHNNHCSDERPDHSCSVEVVQDPDSESIDDPSAQTERHVDEEDVPRLGDVVGVKQSNDAYNKLAGERTGSGGECYPTRDGDPTGKVRDSIPVFWRREAEGPMVLSAGSRENVADFSHAQCACHHAEKCNHHTPKSHRGTTRNKGDGHGGRGSSPGVENAVAETDECEGGEVLFVNDSEVTADTRGRGGREVLVRGSGGGRVCTVVVE